MSKSNIIYANYNENTIRVYQAFSDNIANEAIKLGKFGSEFKMSRMTWIKPSFLWMMYRSGWGTKVGQNRILAIDIYRYGFDEIYKNKVYSSFSKEVYNTKENWKLALENSEVRCQWDPDRDIYGNAQVRRAIQLGIRGDILDKYVNDWIFQIEDITGTVVELKKSIQQGSFTDDLLPVEIPYFCTDN